MKVSPTGKNCVVIDRNEAGLNIFLRQVGQVLGAAEVPILVRHNGGQILCVDAPSHDEAPGRGEGVPTVRPLLSWGTFNYDVPIG